MKAACDVPECGYVAQHPTKYVLAMLGNHKRKVHGIAGKSAKYRQPKPPATPEAPEVENKRPYTRKASPTTGLNFCPCCGVNLRAVRVAISL